MLSVEPWLVELSTANYDKLLEAWFQCSQSSRGWWNVLNDAVALGVPFGFSALSRAVVGGTITRSKPSGLSM